MRKPTDAFSKHKNPRCVNQQMSDFDYLDKLSPEEQEYLAKFVNEYYGADLEIAPTFIVKDGELVQVSKNENKSDNIDLRTLRSTDVRDEYGRKIRNAIPKFYLDVDGSYKTDETLKYGDSLFYQELGKEGLSICNKNKNSTSEDYFLKKTKNDSNAFKSLDEYGQDIQGIDDQLIAWEEYEQECYLEDM